MLLSVKQDLLIIDFQVYTAELSNWFHRPIYFEKMGKFYYIGSTELSSQLPRVIS